MKKLTNKERQRQLQALAAMTDSAIDTSDMPELTMDQLRRAVRGQMYRPIKYPVTMRLDADVIAWLKLDGRGYQTKANSLLRQEMLRGLQRAGTSERVSKVKTSHPRKKPGTSRVA